MSRLYLTYRDPLPERPDLGAPDERYGYQRRRCPCCGDPMEDEWDGDWCEDCEEDEEEPL